MSSAISLQLTDSCLLYAQNTPRIMSGLMNPREALCEGGLVHAICKCIVYSGDQSYDESSYC